VAGCGGMYSKKIDFLEEFIGIIKETNRASFLKECVRLNWNFQSKG